MLSKIGEVLTLIAIRIDDMFLDGKKNKSNDLKWSSSKLAIFLFLYPTATFCLIYDTIVNNRLDWVNLGVYGILIISPRALSNLVTIKLTGKDLNELEKEAKDKKEANQQVLD